MSEPPRTGRRPVDRDWPDDRPEVLPFLPLVYVAWSDGVLSDLGSVARRLKGLIDDGVDSFEAMNACQDHLVALARAWVEGRVLDAFHESVERAPTPDLAEALRSLAALWALERLEADRGWFLESGYLDPPKSRAIRGRVNALCRETAPRAVSLVDAFAIPDEVLRAPAGVRPAGGPLG